MDKYLSGFSDELLNLIFFAEEMMPTSETKKIINAYSKLDKKKLLEKFNTNLSQYKERINKRDTTLFTRDLYVIPEFNISRFWVNATTDGKERIWIALTKLLIYNSIMHGNIPSSTSPPQIDPKHSKICHQEKEKTNELNPYIGIKVNPEEVSVGNMMNEMKEAESSGNPLMNALKDKLNDPELVEKLKHIDDKELSSMTSDVKQIMAPYVDDPNVSGLMDNMLQNITAELKNTDMSNGNIFDNMVKIAEKMSHKLAADTKTGAIDPDKLLKSTQGMMKEMSGMLSQNGGIPGMPPELAGLDPKMLLSFLNI
jgi:hypothetical protein